MNMIPGIETTTIEMTLTEIVGEHALVCDYSELSFCPDLEAQWIGHVRCQTCGYGSERLLCPPCKEFVMHTPDGCRCPACDERVIPFRHAFARFERIDRKA